MLRTAARTAARNVPRVAAPTVRFASSTPAAATPAAKANALLDAVPGNSITSKAGTVVLTTAVSAAAISQELFVLNEEVVILGSFVVFLGYVSSLIRGPYAEWADGQIKKVSDILNTSRTAHTSAVKERIESVGELKDVESLTKQLFALSKETAKLEHESFALKQKVALAAEVKSVLDAWVRHEAQVREAEQAELVNTVLKNVQAQLGDKKLQKDILLASVAEIEGLVKAKAI